MMKRPSLFLTVCSLCIIFYGCSYEYNTPKTVNSNETDSGEGTVTVISNKEELIPYKSWSHGSDLDKDGNVVTADAVQLIARGIESELKSIKYADDFKVKIDGTPRSVRYMTYAENFGAYEGSGYLADKLVIPEEKGIYIIRVEVSWGANDDNYDAYDYVFNLCIE